MRRSNREEQAARDREARAAIEAEGVDLGDDEAFDLLFGDDWDDGGRRPGWTSEGRPRARRGTGLVHGTRTGYNAYGCRCGDCRRANTDYVLRRKRELAGTEPPVHGTLTSYNHYSCRCGPCTRANTAASRRRRQRGV